MTTEELAADQSFYVGELMDLGVDRFGSPGKTPTQLQMCRNVLESGEYDRDEILAIYRRQCEPATFNGEASVGLKLYTRGEEEKPDDPWWTCPPIEWWQAGLVEVTKLLT